MRACCPARSPPWSRRSRARRARVSPAAVSPARAADGSRRRRACTIHVPAARAVHGPNLSAAQRFGDGREAEVVKGEMRFYAARGGPGALRLFRTVAACKFSLKSVLAAATGRAAAAGMYGRVVRACLGFDPGEVAG